MCGLLLAETGGIPQHYEKGNAMDDETREIIGRNLGRVKQFVANTPAVTMEDIIRMQKAFDSIVNIEQALGVDAVIPEATE